MKHTSGPQTIEAAKAKAEGEQAMYEIRDLFKGITGGWTQGRAERFIADMRRRGLNASAYEIVECGDEKTGRRFGDAKIRFGWAVKVGSGGRNRGSRYAYQVWAVVRPEYREGR